MLACENAGGQTAALLGIHAAVAACVALMIYVHQQHALFVVGGEDCRQIYCGDGLADAALQIHYANRFQDVFAPFSCFSGLLRSRTVFPPLNTMLFEYRSHRFA